MIQIFFLHPPGQHELNHCFCLKNIYGSLLYFYLKFLYLSLSTSFFLSLFIFSSIAIATNQLLTFLCLSPCLSDLNECEETNGGCEGSCCNTIGSYYCKCSSGLKLKEDGKTCQGEYQAAMLIFFGCIRIPSQAFGQFITTPQSIITLPSVSL